MANKTATNNDIALSIYLGSKEKRGHELQKYMQDVVKFLVRRRLISKIPGILFKLKKIINKENGVVEVKVSSTHRLANETKHNLAHEFKKRYKAKEIVWDEIIDESLLGGLKIEAEGEVIDLSIKNKVKKLQEHLIRKI